MEENKYEDSDSDDDYKEVVVNDSDFRREIYEFPEHRDLMIIKSIGQIESQYDYKIEKDFKISAVGTGTVYHVANNVAFVVTCAHNIRHRIFECPKCDIYKEKKSGSQCAETLDSSHKKILKPTHIEFKRRNVTENNFGHVEQVYKCDEIYVPGGYDQNTRLQKGFDFAVLMFKDDGYYSKHCDNITFDIGKDTLNKYKRFCMFGYPGIDCANAKKNKLYGYAMKSDAKDKGFELKECEESKNNFKNKTQYVLRQRQLDASAGQSGSVVFAVTGKMEAIVFAVHVGGHEKNKKEDYSYNVATLLSEEYIKILRNVTDLYVQHLEKELDSMKERNVKLEKKLKLLNEEKKNDEKENKPNMILLDEFKNENKMGLEMKLNKEKQKNDPILSYGILKTIIIIVFCAIIYKIAFPETHTNITLLNETNAQLQNNLMSLKDEIVKFKKDIMERTNENKILKERNKKLNDKITDLLNEKQKNNVFNEEKKNDEKKNEEKQNDNKIDLNTFWGKHGNNIKINGKIVTYNSGWMGDYNSIYSSLPMSKGIHKIKLKVLEKGSYCTITIGITSTTNYENGWCFGQDRAYNYGYSAFGNKYSHEHGGVSGVSSYDINDIIVIMLDFNNLILSLDKNNKNIYKINIKKHKYYIAISMGYYGWYKDKGSSVSIEIV